MVNEEGIKEAPGDDERTISIQFNQWAARKREKAAGGEQ